MPPQPRHCCVCVRVCSVPFT
uniref:Uncharacterized protein n=1 Tax=Anguilla anguilla TaxID=7936 RepID=A0A0E9TFW1_ANGAN